MHYKFSSETPTDDGDSQPPHSFGGFLDMLYKVNKGDNTQIEFP